MKELQQLLDKYFNEQLIHAVISSPRSRGAAAKITIRPVLIKGRLIFQAAIYQEKKVFHRNLPNEEAEKEVLEWMGRYRQLEISSWLGHAIVLVSKKGKAHIKEKPCDACVKEADLSHNRKKNYILDPGKKVGFLVDLGVQSKEGKIIKAKYDKFRQINRFLEFIEVTTTGAYRSLYSR